MFFESSGSVDGVTPGTTGLDNSIVAETIETTIAEIISSTPVNAAESRSPSTTTLVTPVSLDIMAEPGNAKQFDGDSKHHPIPSASTAPQSGTISTKEHVGAIAGATIGGVVGLTLIALFVIWCWKRRGDNGAPLARALGETQEQPMILEKAPNVESDPGSAIHSPSAATTHLSEMTEEMHVNDPKAELVMSPSGLSIRRSEGVAISGNAHVPQAITRQHEDSGVCMPHTEVMDVPPAYSQE
ncbi:hypothetical protein CERSUDRAFT_116890 [Gelatoporia subvermispora B]|uniref:Uncharacterized protein n=1 Tax=Ceriporiopsis subvermispora (strain B) TaxID=914234 RepID=M2QR86_CERS8|nr:hypothetical protein CERSUDRAFT_116890 [Gelatoporia subvermispora B]